MLFVRLLLPKHRKMLKETARRALKALVLFYRVLKEEKRRKWSKTRALGTPWLSSLLLEI